MPFFLNTNITNGMYLIAKLEDEKVEEAPKTLDSLLTFVGAGVVGLGVLGIAVKKYLID